MKQRILITGGAGFIGSNFIRYLLSDPRFAKKIQKIVNLDKLTYSGNPQNLKDLRGDKRYSFIKGDICDKELVFSLVRQCDIIVNFAAESHVDRSIRDPAAFVRTNVTGVQVLLDGVRRSWPAASASRMKKKRFIQISTDEVYGSVVTGSSREDSPLEPNSPYAASKAAADLLARSYYVTYGIPILITRSTNNFGPYQYPEKIIPLFITNALEDKTLPVYADGSNVRDWIFVKDNCDAIAFLMEEGVTGEVYNISAGNEMKNIDLTRRILRIVKKPESLVSFVKDRPGHDKRYSLDASKLFRLGWRPRSRDSMARLQETVDWYRRNQTWWRRLKKRQEKFW